MTRYLIPTYGPCSRCGGMARHILIVDSRRVTVHNDTTVKPCPARPGEMPEAGEPKEITP